MGENHGKDGGRRISHARCNGRESRSGPRQFPKAEKPLDGLLLEHAGDEQIDSPGFPLCLVDDRPAFVTDGDHLLFVDGHHLAAVRLQQLW